MSIPILPTMTCDCSFRVELLEAFLVGARRPLTPDLFALYGQRGALTCEAVPLAFLTRFPVLPVGVSGAGAGETGAGLLEVTLVGRIPTYYAAWFKLQ